MSTESAGLAGRGRVLLVDPWNAQYGSPRAKNCLTDVATLDTACLWVFIESDGIEETLFKCNDK